MNQSENHSSRCRDLRFQVGETLGMFILLDDLVDTVRFLTNSKPTSRQAHLGQHRRTRPKPVDLHRRAASDRQNWRVLRRST